MLGMRCRFGLAGVVAFASFGTAIASGPGPTLQKIGETNTLTLGFSETSFPMSYLDDKKKPLGYSLDLCGLAADKIRETLGLPSLKIVYRAATPATAVELVKTGKIDLDCSAMASTARRERDVAFSIPTFMPEMRWMLPKRSRIKSIGELKERTVVLTKGSPANTLIVRLSVSRSLGISIEQGEDHADSLSYLDTGRAAAFLEDNVILSGLRAKAKNPDAYLLLDETYANDPYGLMFKKDDEPFRKLVDGALTEAMKSGRFEEIYQKWFQSFIPPKGIDLDMPMPEKLRLFIKERSLKSEME